MKLIDADKMIEDIRSSNVPWKGAMHRMLLQADEVKAIPPNAPMVIEWKGAMVPVKKVMWDDIAGRWVLMPVEVPPRLLKVFQKKNRKF